MSLTETAVQSGRLSRIGVASGAVAAAFAVDLLEANGARKRLMTLVQAWPWASERGSSQLFTRPSVRRGGRTWVRR